MTITFEQFLDNNKTSNCLFVLKVHQEYHFELSVEIVELGHCGFLLTTLVSAKYVNKRLYRNGFGE